MGVICEIAKYLWASPATLVGYALGVLGLLTGGGVTRHGIVVEFHGGFVKWFMNRFPNKTILAMTLGYAILGKEEWGLDAARKHEMVHVRQYGVWGAVFLPAYAISSLIEWFRGRDPYMSNIFEREAYAEAPIGPIRPPKPRKTVKQSGPGEVVK